MADQEIVQFLAGVTGVVEANTFERHMLWEENRRRDWPRKWIENTSGLGETIGHIDGRPVYLSLFTAEIDNQKILFLHATSEIVDWAMIEQWLTEKLPKSAFREDGYLNRTDANNFHNVFPRRA